MLKYAFVFLADVTLNGREKHFTKYGYDADFLYRTSYVYDPTNTKTESKGEI